MCDMVRLKPQTEDVLAERELLINDKVDDALIEDIVLKIRAINLEDDEIEMDSKIYKREMAPIHIFINSCGGDADPMFSVISAIESSKTPIYTYCLGKAYSAGFLIFLAGHQRFAQKYSRFMYHQLGFNAPHQDLQSHEETIEFEKETQRIVEALTLSRTKIPKKKLDEIKKSKVDWYMFAAEAKTYGIFSEYF